MDQKDQRQKYFRKGYKRGCKLDGGLLHLQTLNRGAVDRKDVVFRGEICGRDIFQTFFSVNLVIIKIVLTFALPFGKQVASSATKGSKKLSKSSLK